MSIKSAFEEHSYARSLPPINWKHVLLYAVVIFFVAFYVSPVWIAIFTSFKSEAGAATAFLPPTPSIFTLDNWLSVMFGGLAFDFSLFGVSILSLPETTGQDPLSLFGVTLVTVPDPIGPVARMGKAFINSLVMAIPATLLDVLLGSMAAYGLTLVRWRYQVPVLALFLVGIFIPYQAVLVPLSNFWTFILPPGKILANINLIVFTFNFWSFTGIDRAYGDLIALIVTHVAYGIPICVLLFRSYYKTLSTELIEAAKIDGASITKIYTRIVLPLSLPMIGVVLIYQFTQIWNEFLFSFTLIADVGAPEATVTLILGAAGVSLSHLNFGVRMAAALFAALPTIIIYALFAEQFAEGLRT